MWEVIDLVYLEDEGNVVFQGTQEECNRWVAEQKDAFTYQVVPIIESMYAVLVEYTDHRWWEIFDTETEAENYAANKLIVWRVENLDWMSVVKVLLLA